MLAGRVSAPVLRLAQIWQDFHQARLSVERLGDILNTPPEPTYTPGRAALPADPRATSSSTMSTSAIGSTVREVLHDVSFRRARRPGGRHRRPVRLGQEHAHQAGPAPLRARKRPRAGRRHRPRHGRSGLAAPPDRRRAAGERAVQPHGPREHRARRSGHADGARDRARPSSPARTNSSSSCPKATTRSSASAAPPCPAASASASPSPARWSPIRAS